MNNLYTALYLKFYKGLGPIKIKKLIEDSKVNMIDFGIKEIKEKVEVEIEKIEKNKISTITLFDQDYPYLLKNIADPPVILYYKGILRKDISLIAVVGTRKPSPYGINSCEYIVSQLVKNNIGIVSGLAIGIDSISHKTAFNNDGYTIAVLGSGIDKVYPRTNRDISERIIERGGCLISEFEIGTEPSYYTFPQRNRIISGISSATLVVEASLTSGALITAKISAEQGRPVFSIPGSIFKDSFKGTNTLIREGGILIRDAYDIINELPIIRGFDHRKMIKDSDLSEEERVVYNTITDNTSIESIVSITGFQVSKILSILSSLVVKDLIKEEGGIYSRKY